MPEKRKVHLSTPERLTSGAIAGAVGKSSVAPFQRVQIMYQVNVGQKLSLQGGLQTAKDIVRNEGVSALWRGNVANAGRSAPTAAIKFWSQSLYSAKIRQMNWSKGTSQFLGGSMSGVTTVAATYPLDLFRTKLAANKEYKGYMDCAMKTVQRSGISGLYHGISAPIVGSIPHTGIAFWMFYHTKRLMGIDENSTEAAPLRRTCAGFLAGFAGQTVTYPFSTIRRRMQTSVEWQQKGLIKCGIDTVKHEGFLGLFRAYSIHAFKGPVSAAISFACNDIIKQKMKEYKMEREEEKEKIKLEDEQTQEILLTEVSKEPQKQV